MSCSCLPGNSTILCVVIIIPNLQMEKLRMRLPNIHSNLLLRNKTLIVFGKAMCQTESIFPFLAMGYAHVNKWQTMKYKRKMLDETS